MQDNLRRAPCAITGGQGSADSAPAVSLEAEAERGELRPLDRLVKVVAARIAAQALARRHRVLQAIAVPAAHRLMRYRTVHYELRPDAGHVADAEH